VSEVASVTGGEFRGRATHEGTRFHLVLEGTADYAALDALEMLLDRTHAEALRLGVEQVVVDLRTLEFMNSSCFKCFLSWITAINELEVEARYRIELRSSALHHWQKRSLQALRCFAVELISVTEV
jgi:hypothetical protein